MQKRSLVCPKNRTEQWASPPDNIILRLLAGPGLVVVGGSISGPPATALGGVLHTCHGMTRIRFGLCHLGDTSETPITPVKGSTHRVSEVEAGDSANPLPWLIVQSNLNGKSSNALITAQNDIGSTSERNLQKDFHSRSQTQADTFTQYHMTILHSAIGVTDGGIHAFGRASPHPWVTSASVITVAPVTGGRQVLP